MKQEPSLTKLLLIVAGICAALVMLVLLATPSHAQTKDPAAAYSQDATTEEYPLFDAKHRASVYAGANYEFWSAEGTESAPPFDKEFSFGGGAVYNIVPKLNAVGAVFYLTDNNLTRTTLGGDYTYFSGLFDLGVGMRYEFLAGKNAPPPGKEFTLGLTGGYGLNRWLVATGSAFYAMDSKSIRSAVGLRAVLIQPKN